MKKFAKIFALALVCVMSVVALVACGGNTPNTDLASAEKNMKDNGYKVQVVKKTDTGAALILAPMATIYGLKVENIETYFSGNKGSEETAEALIMVEFVDEAAAKEGLNSINDTIKKMRDEITEEIEKYEAEIKNLEDGEEKTNKQQKIDELKDELKSFDDMIRGVSGKVVYVGTSAAISATK